MGITQFALVTLMASTTQILAAPPADLKINYQFRSLSVCSGCATTAGGINDEGLVGASSPTQGYVLNVRTGMATPIQGALAVTVPGDNGVVPGITATSTGIVPLVRTSDGAIHVLPGFPGATITAIVQFNLLATRSVGWASADFASFFSFERSSAGDYRKLTYDGPVGDLTLGTFLLGVNTGGTMVGYLANPAETETAGLIRHPNGTWERFSIQGSSSTVLYSINELGALAGGFKDSLGWHGFVWFQGWCQKIDYPGAANTTLTGINNLGELVGITFTTPSPLIGPTAAFHAVPFR